MAPSEHPNAVPDSEWLAIIEECDPILRKYLRTAASHDDGDAMADLLAETHVLAWVDRAALRGSDKPIALLIQYARAVVRTRVTSRRHEIAFDDKKAVTLSSPLNTPPSGTVSVADAVARQEWVGRVLGRLSEQQRLAVYLRIYWGMLTEIVARLLGVTEGTVRVHVYHGLKRLRRIVMDDPFPSSDESNNL
jgi:RNA polymerase sigma factor (sigma-70 family)